MEQLELGLEIEPVELPGQLVRTLREFYQQGYRYIARDKDMELVTCYSLKPKKYQDGKFWGYADPDAQGVLPAYPIFGADIPDIKWTNKSATLIEYFLADA